MPKTRDPRLITIHRGGSLSDEDHRALAVWAARCAERALAHFEAARPGDGRPRGAIEAALAWSRGEISVNESKRWAWEANSAARGEAGAAKFAAISAGQAAAVAHVAAHDLGAAAYAIRAAMAAAGPERASEAGMRERALQLELAPPRLLDLVVEDQANRDGICWGVFGF